MKVYALIKGGGHFIGFFSSMKKMKIVVEALIKENYETCGSHGWYHFRYAVFDMDEPWFVPNGKDDINMDESRSVLSLNTLHPEYFHHTIENDPNTGEIINWDKFKTTY